MLQCFLLKENGQDGESKRDHLWRFFHVSKDLFRYLIMKLKMFLGMFCCTIDHTLHIRYIMETSFILNQNLIHLYWSKKILLSKRNGTFTIHNKG